MIGPCAKQVVKCTLTCTDGSVFVGENYCENPQVECPRQGMASGEGYEICKRICMQKGHAEVVALEMAGALAIGATAEITGHTYVCQACESALIAGGVAQIKIS